MVRMLGSHYRTQSNFDSSGTSQDLALNGSLSHTNGGLLFEYGFREQLAMIAGVGLANTAVDTSLVDPSKTGLDHFFLGARFVAPEPRVGLFFDAGLEFPLYARLNAAEWARLDRTSEAPLGNGSALITLKGTLELPIARRTVFGTSFGYTHRTEGYSSFLPYAAFFKFTEPNNFFGRAGITGTFHATGDQYTNQILATERAKTVVAGSQAFNAIDPRFLALDLGAGIYLSPDIELAVGYQREISGRNSPVGHHFLGALSWKIKTDSDVPAPHASNTPEQRAASNRGFYEYTGLAKVIRVNNALRLFLINQGRTHGIKVGEYLDVFSPKEATGDAPGDTIGKAFARARVVEAGPTRSKLEILETFPTGKDNNGNPIPLREGFVVRRPLP